jgi:hypothetical protein
MVFMLVLAFVLVFGGLGCFPYPHECDAVVDFIFRKNLAGFLKFP